MIKYFDFFPLMYQLEDKGKASRMILQKLPWIFWDYPLNTYISRPDCTYFYCRSVNPSVQSVRLRVRTGRTAYPKDARDGRVSRRPSGRLTGTDGRGLQLSRIAESLVRLHVTGGP